MSKTEQQPTKLYGRIQHILVILLRLSVAVAGGLAIYFRDWGALTYCLLTLLLMFLPELIESRAKINLPIEFDLTLVVFMFTAVFVGKVGFAYERFWWWDAVLHTGAGFILGYIGFLVLYVKIQQKKIQASRLLVGLIIFSLGLSFGTLWEIFEFTVDSFFAQIDLQRHSLRDTMWDLIIDGIGALIMAKIGVHQIFDEPKGFIANWTQKFLRDNPHLKEILHD